MIPNYLLVLQAVTRAPIEVVLLLEHALSPVRKVRTVAGRYALSLSNTTFFTLNYMEMHSSGSK